MRVAESQWTGSYNIDDITKVGPLYNALAARYAPFVMCVLPLSRGDTLDSRSHATALNGQ